MDIGYTLLASEPSKTGSEREFRRLRGENASLRRRVSLVSDAHREMAESLAEYRAMLDNSTAVIYIKDREGRYILINHRYETLFHVTLDEIKGKSDYDIFPAAQAGLYRANDRRVLECGSPLEMEESVPHDGGVHTYVSLKVPLKDAAGVPYAVCGISTDITERKLAEESVERERQRLEALVDTLPTGVFVAEAPSGRPEQKPKGLSIALWLRLPEF